MSVYINISSPWLSRRLSRLKKGRRLKIPKQGVSSEQMRWCVTVVALTVLASCSAPPQESSSDSVDPAPIQTSTPVVPTPPIEQKLQKKPTPQPSKAKPADRLAVGELRRVLRDATQDINRRRQAAVEILALGDAQANKILIKDLTTAGSDQVTQQLILQALLAMDQEPPQVFIEPLLGLVARAQHPLLNDVAQALSRLKGRKHIRRLIALAQDRSTHVRRRRGAIIALGYYRDRHVVGKLVRLIQTKEPANSH